MKRVLFIYFLFISTIACSQVNLNLGLRAYYPFTGNANDASGNGHNPVINTATLTTDRLGNANSAYHFNGVNNYIQIPNTPAGPTSINTDTKISLCAWVRPQGFYQGHCHGNSIMMKGDADYLVGNYSLRFDDNFYTNGLNCSSAAVDETHQNFYGIGTNALAPGYTPYIQPGQWYSVVYTYDGNMARLYVNCELKMSNAYAGLTFANAYDLFLGNLNNSSYPYWFNGDMDEVRIYDRPLNQDEVNAYGGCSTTALCNNWLSTPSQASLVTIGDLDIPGNKVTVEATANRTSFLANGGPTDGDLVSKHTGPADANYLLRPTGAIITTSNGFFATPNVCDIELNKIYHYAMVYDGASLKFYRNGFLMSQVPATGNLVQNNLLTSFGLLSAQNLPENFVGYMNEVRIWNVARTQSQIQAYMNSALPNPTTQPGLLAYYTFNDLLNKQGNAAWNGTLLGSAAINATNPVCSFTADSCKVITPISNIINEYTPVLALNPCNNKITVEDASKFNVGDTVLLIQMKGAVIDSTNTTAFGTITDYKNAGNYEYNYVKSKTGNIIELKNNLTRQYDVPIGKVQLIRVPYYLNADITATLTCLPWDGKKGGVLAMNVRDSLTMHADINVNGNGFRGGINGNNLTNTWNCFQSNYGYPSNSTLGSPKGEGITTLINTNGRGALANGGGGGDDHNSGGAGGGNANFGGNGGNQYEGCLGTAFDNGGQPGKAVLGFSTVTKKIFMGGGGGSGHANNIAGFNPNGGNGGGIIIISTPKLINNNFSVLSRGADGTTCTSNAANDNCNEGMGGGGAGGTVLLDVNSFVNNVNINVNGGNGADVNYFASTAPGDPNKHGPGGGGSGGVIWFKGLSAPPPFTTNYLTGGLNGKNIFYSNDRWGALPGGDGVVSTNLTLPVDNVLFKKNIDSVRFKDSLTTCLEFDFKGFGFTNSNPVASWDWYFGDAGTAHTQNASHNYASAGTYLVKLVITDINGCKDSISRNVISNTLSVDAGSDSTFCTGATVSVQLHGTGSGNFFWTPAAYLDNSTAANPIATVSTTTTFYLNVLDALGCSGTDSVTIHINSAPTVTSITDPLICQGDSLRLTTTGALNYHWYPGTLVSDSLIASPLFTGTGLSVLIVTGTDASGCKASDTVHINVLPKPVVRTIADTLICSTQPITLTTTGAVSYSWSPATHLDNPNVASPLFSGNSSQTYYVTGTGGNGCKAKDTVSVTVNNPHALLAPPGKSVCQKDAVHLNGNNGNSVQYLWSPGDHLSSTTIIDPLANPLSSTLYTVTITDPACHYDSTFTVLVNVMSLPVIKASKLNDINCASPHAQLNASGGIVYVWSPASSLNNSNIANPVASPTSNTEYVVTGTDNNGCTNKDSLTVLAKAGMNAYDIPNSFTPNRDGVNDCFGIKHWGSDSKDVYFIIYNRFGEKVFETHDVNVCWDGTFKGNPADAGTYVYYARAITACGQLLKKGNVLLIR